MASIAGTLAHKSFSMGEKATLRRMNPRVPGAAVVSVQRLLHGAGVSRIGDDDFERWTLIVHCLALARGRHDPRKATGKVLHDVFHGRESRLTQLLAADGDVLFDLLPRVARRLDSADAAIDWLPLAQLAPWASRPDDNFATAEKQRRDIALDFVRAQESAHP